MNYTKAKEFSDGLAVLTRQGFNPFCVYTQSVHETGWFARVIGKFNFWGLKAPKWWKGPVVDIPTHEWTFSSKETCAGLKCNITEPHHHKTASIAKFMDFTDIVHAMDTYCDRIKKIYPKSFEARSNPQIYFEMLCEGKFGAWSTNPNYAISLKNLCDQIMSDQISIEILMPRVKEHLDYLNSQNNS